MGDSRQVSGERQIHSTGAASVSRNPALHGAMNPGPQERDLGLAVERQQRGPQQLGAKAGCANIFHNRAFRLVPGQVEAII